MSHMVIYRSVEGSPVFQQVETLEDAARHVETLRNAGQGDDARIFAMKEVKIAVKTYYKVEVEGDEAPAAAAAPAPAEAAAPAPAPAAAAAPAAAPAPKIVADNSAAAAPAAPQAQQAPAAVKPEPAVAGAAANGGRFGLFGKG
jgi:hypothetical protein